MLFCSAKEELINGKKLQIREMKNAMHRSFINAVHHYSGIDIEQVQLGCSVINLRNKAGHRMYKQLSRSFLHQQCRPLRTLRRPYPLLWPWHMWHRYFQNYRYALFLVGKR